MARLRWLGHAGFEIVTPQGKRLYLDPWLTGNPSAPVAAEDLEPADAVLVTHDHADHLGDAPELLAQGAASAGQPEMVGMLQEKGVPADNLVPMNCGGTVDLDGIKVTMLPAWHSATNGSPVGFIITLEDGRTIYHAGDTSLAADFQVWGQVFDLELALLPIGDVFTMDPVQAAQAVKMLRPRIAVPMHFGTFPVLVQDASLFEQEVKRLAPETRVVTLQPGEPWEF